jgi:hypothetical protein
MGIMECSRKNCNNIMCDTYVQSVGYICSECQSEFKEYLQKNGLNPTTEGQIKRELGAFMAIPKDSYITGKEITVDDFFNEHTREC